MKNKKGFTLIEILAAITILGLLIAIAMPSVSKYITQSRKKSLLSSIDGYINAVKSNVSSRKYDFTRDNTIFAVPIECSSLEKGGNNPLGKWAPVSDDYWAYVLVQYDSKKYTYTYGFTFKDSAGFGMYPTKYSDINHSNMNIIKQNLNLSKPKTGLYSNIALKDDWTGFNIKDDTRIVIVKDDVCEVPKPCTTEVSETEVEIGTVITCEDEKFYVIDNTQQETITMLTEYSIGEDTELKKFRQANEKVEFSAKVVNFSSTAYWSNGDKVVDEEYGDDYPAYVYDDNSNLHKYVEQYEEYLAYIGASGARAKLISIEQLELLGCKGQDYTDPSDVSCSNPDDLSACTCNSSSYNWLKLPLKSNGSYQLYWTGSAYVNSYVFFVSSSGHLGNNNAKTNTYQIRPIVTIAKTQIEFSE